MAVIELGTNLMVVLFMFLVFLFTGWVVWCDTRKK